FGKGQTNGKNRSRSRIKTNRIITVVSIGIKLIAVPPLSSCSANLRVIFLPQLAGIITMVSNESLKSRLLLSLHFHDLSTFEYLT
ncbi:unnamed protein product, partial [Urochloa humidicola]